MPMTELKSCPFCGSENVKDLHKVWDTKHAAFIQCHDCNARTDFCTGPRQESYSTLAAKAAEVWNRRIDNG